MPARISVHTDIGDYQRQAWFALDPVQTFGTASRGDDVIFAIQKQFFYENADPIIILHDDQHLARGSILNS